MAECYVCSFLHIPQNYKPFLDFLGLIQTTYIKEFYAIPFKRKVNINFERFFFFVLNLYLWFVRIFLESYFLHSMPSLDATI